MREPNIDDLNLKILSALLELLYQEDGLTLFEAECFCLGICDELNVDYNGSDSIVDTFQNIAEIVEYKDVSGDYYFSLNESGIEFYESAVGEEVPIDLVLNESGKTCNVVAI